MTHSPLHREFLSLAGSAGYAPQAVDARLSAREVIGMPDRKNAERIAGDCVNRIAGGGKVAVADVLREAFLRTVHPDAIPYLLAQYAAQLQSAGKGQWSHQVGVLTGRENGIAHNGDDFYRDGARLYAETDRPNPPAVVFRDAIADALGEGVTIHEPGCGRRPKDLSCYLSDPAVTAGMGYEICLPAAIAAREDVTQKDLSHRVQIHAGRLRDVVASHPDYFPDGPAATVHCSVTHFAAQHELRADFAAEARIADLIADARKCIGASPWDNGDLLLRRFGSGGHRKLSARDNVPRSFLHPEYQEALYGSVLVPQGFELVHAQNQNVGIYDSPQNPETMHEQIWVRRRGKAWRR